MIVVDDGSSDATAAVAGAHPGRLPVEVISLGTNQGPGRAFDRGFRRALEVAPEDGFVVTLEADTTSDLDALGGMLELARGGADVVLASTHAPGGGLSNVGLLPALCCRARPPTRCAARAAWTRARSRPSTASTAPRSCAQGYARHGDTLVRERGFACKAELLFKLARLGARLEEVPVVIDWSQREGEPARCACSPRWPPTCG